jgi:hypothetical protein
MYVCIHTHTHTHTRAHTHTRTHTHNIYPRKIKNKKTVPRGHQAGWGRLQWGSPRARPLYSLASSAGLYTRAAGGSRPRHAGRVVKQVSVFVLLY